MSENDMAKIARLVADPHADATATIIIGEFTISKLRSGEAVEFDNGVTVLPASDLATTEALRARVAELEAALVRCKTVLGNMALENGGATFNRWPISHEPLRNDARNLLPIIDAALSETVEA